VILIVSLNPAIDITHHVPTADWSGVNRPSAVLDAHGEALLRGATARPAIVKPNLAELEAIAGRRLSTARGADREAVASAARELKAAGPQAVVVSLGADGLLAITDEGSWLAVPPAEVAGNPTGDADYALVLAGVMVNRDEAC
jgi:tagatose 6-phosphate kinase